MKKLYHFPRPCTRKDSDTQKFYDDIFGDQDAVPGFTIVDRSLEDIIKDEINNYLKKTVPLNRAESISFDVLQWWKEHKNEFPHLFLLSKKYMHIPATSTSSESIFFFGK